MQTDMDLGEHYDTAFPPDDSCAGSSSTAHGSVYRTGITPPRLHAIDPAATQAISTVLTASAVLIADLRLPVEVVRERAEVYAARARSEGIPHSMRLWRQCFEQALTMLARETNYIPADASCEALFWQQKDDEYWISATFGRGRSLPTLH
jgi:hypothetical protein